MSYNTITSCHNLQILSGAGKGGGGIGGGGITACTSYSACTQYNHK